MFIRTERLFLRPVFPEDWAQVLAGIRDERIVRMLARAPWPYRADDARSFCAAGNGHERIRCAVTLPGKGGAPLIGCVGMAEEDGVGELGYWLARRYHGQGFATEAARGLIAIARMLGIRRIEAGHILDNPASGRVLARLGFRETGELRPMASLGRNGEQVLTRRYALQLSGEEGGPLAASAA